MASPRQGLGAARLTIFAVSLLSLVLSAPGCGRKKGDANDPIVARVAETVIRKSDFVSAVARAPRDTWAPLDSLDHAGRMEFLNTMLSKRLLEMEALRRYPTLPPETEYILRKAERDIVMAMLANDFAPAKRLSGGDIEECRKALAFGYSAHTLLVDTEARGREVAAGQWTDESFNELVRSETLEMKVEETLGKNFLRQIRAPQFVPEALPQLEGAKAGTILGPYRKRPGWVLYRISEVLVPPDSATADTAGLADACRNMRRAIALREATDRLIDNEKIEYNEENLAWTQKLYADTLLAAHAALGRELLGRKDALLPAVGETDRARELVRISGQPFTVGQFLDEMAQRPITDFPSILHRGSIRLLVEQMVTDQALWREAEKRGYPKRTEVTETLAGRRVEVTLNYLLDEYLYEEAGKRVTEDALLQYVKDHQGDFMTRGKINLEVIYLDDYSLGVKLTTRLKRGESFKAVAADAKRGDPSAEIVASTGLFDGSDDLELYNFGREIEVGGATGPIRKQNGRYVVHRVLDHGPPEPKELDEVRRDVLTAVTFLEREKMLEELISQLRNAQPIEIYEDKL
jgi:hypothetical protein